MTRQTDMLIARGGTVKVHKTLLLLTLLCAGWAFNASALRSITLGWNPSSGPNPAGYYVYTLEESAAVPSRQDAGQSTQATISGLKEGLNYRFTVTTYNALGMESAPSIPVDYMVPVPLEILQPTLAAPYVRLRFPVASGRWYELQASSDLRTWTTIWQTGVVQVYTIAEYQDGQATDPGPRFYRLIIH